MKGIRTNLAFMWLMAMLVSIAIALGGIAWGMSVDCKPGPSDGQCGLSSFLGAVYGVGGGIAVLLCATVFLLVVAYRRRRST